MTRPRVRVGVAGLGFGASVHVPALRAAGADVVALAGTDLERTRRAAHDIGVPTACQGVEELIHAGVDAVSLALPPDVNQGAVRACLQAGLPVLCEKPIAASLKDALRLRSIAGRTTTAVDLLFGELETFRTLREELARARFGSVHAVRIQWIAQSWAQKTRTWSWKTDKARGGGVLATLGSHAIYLIEQLFGSITNLSARCDAAATEKFAPDGAEPATDSVRFKATTSKGIEIDAFFTNSRPNETVHRWQLATESGEVVNENLGRDYVGGFVLRGADGKELAAETNGNSDGRIRGMTAICRRFLDGVQTHEPTEPSIEDGIRIQTVMDAIERSGSLGGSVQTEDDVD